MSKGNSTRFPAGSGRIITDSYMGFTGSNVPARNPIHGGQHGYAPNIREFVSNQAHVSRPLIPVLLEAPKLFTLLQSQVSNNNYVKTLKAIVETHALSITGLDETLTVQVDERRVGGAGAQQQEVVDVLRAQPQISMNFVEKYGLPIQTFLEFWIRYGLMDPDVKHPLAGVIQGLNLKDFGPDMYSMTMMFYEPDAVFHGVTRAWLVTNMFPLSAGPMTSQRDLSTAQQILDLDIEFTGLAQTGPAVRRFATELMHRTRVNHADPYFRKSAVDMNGIDPKVEAADVFTGYRKTFQDTAKESQFIHEGVMP